MIPLSRSSVVTECDKAPSPAVKSYRHPSSAETPAGWSTNTLIGLINKQIVSPEKCFFTSKMYTMRCKNNRFPIFAKQHWCSFFFVSIWYRRKNKIIENTWKSSNIQMKLMLFSPGAVHVPCLVAVGTAKRKLELWTNRPSFCNIQCANLYNMIIRCYRLNARPCFLFLSFRGGTKE